MRLSRGLAVTGALGLLLPALFVGCFSPVDDCLKAYNCPPSGVATTSSSSGGEGGGVPQPECIPSQATGSVADSCGVFVSSSTGVDSNSGTSKATPVATLAHAIDLAEQAKKPVYACAEDFNEAIVVPAGLEIFGGLDCKAGWSYSDAGRTKLAGAADEVPLKLSAGGAGATTLENMSVTAANAVKPGGSSIAVIIIDNVTANLTRCDFVAGNGVDGAAGETPATPPGDGAPGMAGVISCTDPPTGGMPGMTTCGAETNGGGKGGDGGIPNDPDGKGGNNGQPFEPNSPLGLGGSGATAVVTCDVGKNGRQGEEGIKGLGGSALGTISLAGYVGADGQDGGNGKQGQGGGGGGGYKSGKACGVAPYMDGPGASGGGGGAGGCGGFGGIGGKAGGASIGVIALNATLNMAAITVTTGNGGKGGDGSIGALGGAGGVGGDGGKAVNALTQTGCVGGKGGTGGFGGSSGGGRGGHSIGIAYMGASAPDVKGVTVTPGKAGDGGLDLVNGGPGNGDPGLVSTDPVQFQ